MLDSEAITELKGLVADIVDAHDKHQHHQEEVERFKGLTMSIEQQLRDIVGERLPMTIETEGGRAIVIRKDSLVVCYVVD